MKSFRCWIICYLHSHPTLNAVSCFTRGTVCDMMKHIRFKCPFSTICIQRQQILPMFCLQFRIQADRKCLQTLGITSLWKALPRAITKTIRSVESVMFTTWTDLLLCLSARRRPRGPLQFCKNPNLSGSLWESLWHHALCWPSDRPGSRAWCFTSFYLTQDKLWVRLRNPSVY